MILFDEGTMESPSESWRKLLEKVAISSTLNALHQLVMLHLWLNDPPEQCFNILLYSHLNLKRRGKEEWDKYPTREIIWPTSGRLRWLQSSYK